MKNWTQDKSSGVKLTGEELKKLFEPALLIAGSTVRGYSFAELYEGGTDAVAYRLLTDDTGFGDTRMEKGTWRFDGDKVCVRPIHRLLDPKSTVGIFIDSPIAAMNPGGHRMTRFLPRFG